MIHEAVVKALSLMVKLFILPLAAMFTDAEFVTYFRLTGLLGSSLLLVMVAFEMLLYVGQIGEITRAVTAG